MRHNIKHMVNESEVNDLLTSEIIKTVTKMTMPDNELVNSSKSVSGQAVKQYIDPIVEDIQKTSKHVDKLLLQMPISKRQFWAFYFDDDLNVDTHATVIYIYDEQIKMRQYNAITPIDINGSGLDKLNWYLDENNAYIQQHDTDGKIVSVSEDKQLIELSFDEAQHFDKSGFSLYWIKKNKLVLDLLNSSQLDYETFTNVRYEVTTWEDSSNGIRQSYVDSFSNSFMLNSEKIITIDGITGPSYYVIGQVPSTSHSLDNNTFFTTDVYKSQLGGVKLSKLFQTKQVIDRGNEFGNLRYEILDGQYIINEDNSKVIHFRNSHEFKSSLDKNTEIIENFEEKVGEAPYEFKNINSNQFLNDAFYVNSDLTKYTKFIWNSTNYVYDREEVDWAGVKQETILISNGALNENSTDLEFETFILNMLQNSSVPYTGTDLSSLQLIYNDNQRYRLSIYNTNTRPVFIGSEVLSEPYINWDLAYYTLEGDINSRYTSVLYGTIDKDGNLLSHHNSGSKPLWFNVSPNPGTDYRVAREVSINLNEITGLIKNYNYKYNNKEILLEGLGLTDRLIIDLNILERDDCKNYLIEKVEEWNNSTNPLTSAINDGEFNIISFSESSKPIILGSIASKMIEVVNKIDNDTMEKFSIFYLETNSKNTLEEYTQNTWRFLHGDLDTFRIPSDIIIKN